MVPRIQLEAEPKFSLPLPPPKELAPTESREKPMAVTTEAATMGVRNLFRQDKHRYIISAPEMHAAAVQ